MNSRTSWTNAAMVVCGIFQVFHAISAVLLVVAAIHVIISPDSITSGNGQPISVAMFGMNVSLSDVAAFSDWGAATVPGVVVYLLSGCARAVMLVKAYGNIRGVLDYSRTQPPFRWENVEKLREAGALFLATYAVHIAYALLSLIFGFGAVSVYVNLNLDNLVIGIIILCVSELFAQSVKMQEDVENLV